MTGETGNGSFIPEANDAMVMATRKRSTAAGRPKAKKKRATDELRALRKEVAELRRRQAVLYAALDLPEKARRGQRGSVGELHDMVLKVQDYLLRTGERIDAILGTLKNHRELLVKMNHKVYAVESRERISLELEVMKNTLSVLVLNGVAVDESLAADIDEARASSHKEDVNLPSLRKSKESLQKRLKGEVDKIDQSTLFRSRRKEVPGYR